MKLTTFLPAALAIGASAQATSSSYVDSKTGITFQAAAVSADYTFGVALDTAMTSTDFIGTFIAKGTAGYAGVSLGGGMAKNLLLAAWPSGTKLISSFRQTPKIGPPPEVTGTFSMVPIANGTYTNATHYVYTFLCSKCLQSDGTTFAANASTGSLGWAYSATASPTKPTDHASALPKHSANGMFTLDLAKARSASFESWSKYAAPGMAVREFTA